MGNILRKAFIRMREEEREMLSQLNTQGMVKAAIERMEDDKVDSMFTLEAENSNERELTIWLRETWLNEGKPNGTAFFAILKSYLNKDGSPIVEHYTAGKNGAGIRWNTGNATNHMTKKAIQNAVSRFKKEL